MPVWFSQFFFLSSVFILILMINKEKLEALEEKYDNRKKQKKAQQTRR